MGTNPPLTSNIRNNNISKRIASKTMLKRYVRLLLGLHGIKVSTPYYEMIYKIIRLKECSGSTLTVQYLKSAKLLLDHYISGNPTRIKGLPGSVRVASSHGLPLIIPKVLRFEIQSINPSVIKVVQGILSVFRVLPAKPELKLSSITDEFSGLTTKLKWDKIAEVGLTHFEPIRGINPKGLSELLLLKTAGPNFKPSILGAAADAYSHKLAGGSLEPIGILSRYFGSDLHQKLMAEIEYLSDIQPKDLLYKLGRLSTKIEPAGKVRVFAIVDIGTQSVLMPIHSHVFSILKKIDQDGCFDQQKPLQRLMNRGLMEFYSFDLSSATDRFPIDLQTQVLSCLYTTEVAYAGKSLLIDREFHFKSSRFESSTGVYKYAVGQPMGALSSGAVFSLSHHFVVQYAAFELGGKTGFEDYALLGDDIVIGNREVADRYFYIMTEILGVKINTFKSLKSTTGIAEFAKRLVSPTADYSPCGPKNVVMVLKEPSTLPTLIYDYVVKGGYVEPEQLENWLKELKGLMKISASNLEKLQGMIQGPFGFLNSGRRIGPARAESTLTGSFIDSNMSYGVTNVIDDVLETRLFYDACRALDKSMRSILHLKEMREIPGFESDTIGGLPSFNNLILASYERCVELLCYKPEIPLPTETIECLSDLIKFKLDNMKDVFAADSFSETRVERPRFRTNNIEFLKEAKVSSDLLPIREERKRRQIQPTPIDFEQCTMVPPHAVKAYLEYMREGRPESKRIFLSFI